MKAFSCPQCAAVLEFERIEKSWVRCQYCNSLVVVPAELRPPLAEPPRAPQTSFGVGNVEPKKIAVAVALLVLGFGLVLFLVNSRTSNRNGRGIVTLEALAPASFRTR